MDVRLPCGFSMLIVGASGSGKSVFTKNLLKSKDTAMKNAPNRILWCYGVYQPLFDQLKKTIPNITFHNGVPSLEMLILCTPGDIVMQPCTLTRFGCTRAHCAHWRIVHTFCTL